MLPSAGRLDKNFSSVRVEFKRHQRGPFRELCYLYLIYILADCLILLTHFSDMQVSHKSVVFSINSC